MYKESKLKRGWVRFHELAQGKPREEYTKEDFEKLKHTSHDTNILLLIGLIFYIPIAFIFKLVELNN